MADVILHNHLLLPVINRLGIKLGFGDATISQVCINANIDVAFFLEIINTFHNDKYFPQEKLSSFPISWFVSYLRKTHAYYLMHIIPQMEDRLDAMRTDISNENMTLLMSFFAKYRQEIKLHLKEEEDFVFPYLLALECFEKNEITKSELKQQFSGKFALKSNIEHDDMDDKLLDLKNLIIKYTPPNYDIFASVAFLNSLFHFEQDMKNHARIEDKILYPKVLEIEKLLM